VIEIVVEAVARQMATLITWLAVMTIVAIGALMVTAVILFSR